MMSEATAAVETPAPPQEHKSIAWPYFLIAAALLALYGYLTFTAPQASTSDRYDISPTALLIIRVSFIAILGAIWFAAVYGWQRVHAYVALLKASTEAANFRKISYGLAWLVSGLILPTILGSFRSANIDSPLALTVWTIIINYVYVVFPLVGFLLLYRAIHSLQADKENVRHWSPGIFVAIVAIGIMYFYSVFTNPNRQVGVAADVAASYYLHDVLIVLTIILPTLFAWYLGLQASLGFKHYARKASGLIYQAAFSRLASGIRLVIVFSVLLQILISLGTNRLLGMSLESLLVIIYLFYLINLWGFLVIASGAKRLSKIETV